MTRPRGAAMPGTTVIGALFTWSVNGTRWPWARASTFHTPGVSNVGCATYTPRPFGSPTRSYAVGVTGVHEPWGPLNRTVTAGPLANLMPFFVLCDEREDQALRLPGRVQVAREHEREVGLRVRGGAGVARPGGIGQHTARDRESARGGETTAEERPRASARVRGRGREASPYPACP